MGRRKATHKSLTKKLGRSKDESSHTIIKPLISSPCIGAADMGKAVQPSCKENVKSFPDLLSMLCQQQRDVVILFSSDGWECKKCNISEPLSHDSLAKLTAHLSCSHNAEIGTLGKNNSLPKKAVHSESCVQRPCPHCSQVCKNLLRHIQRFHSVPSKTKSKLSTPSKKRGYKKSASHGYSAFVSNSKGMSIYSVDKLKANNQCNSDFTNNTGLAMHLTQKHDGNKLFLQTRKRIKTKTSSGEPSNKRVCLDICMSNAKQRSDDKTPKAYLKQKDGLANVRALPNSLGMKELSWPYNDKSQKFVTGEKTETAEESAKTDRAQQLLTSISETQPTVSSLEAVSNDDSDTDVYISENDSKYGTKGKQDPDKGWNTFSKPERPGMIHDSFCDYSCESKHVTSSTKRHLKTRKMASLGKRMPVAHDMFASFYRKQVQISLPICEFCNHHFINETARDSHVQHYEGHKIEKCSQCENVFHNSDVLNVHLLFDHCKFSVQGQCYSCKNVKDSKRSIVKHMTKCHAMSKGLTPKQLHLDSLVTRRCDLCRQHLLCDPHLITFHNRAHRRDLFNKKDAKASSKARKTAKNGTSGTKCCTCERVFKNKYLAFFHSWLDHNSDNLPFQGASMLEQETRHRICEMVEEEQASVSVAGDNDERDGKISFWCKVCGTMLHDWRMKILKHLGLHHNRLFANSKTYLNKKHGLDEDKRVRMIYQCPECKEEILDVRNRVGFHRLTHGLVDDTNHHLKCKHCPAFFFCVSRVKRHEKTKHLSQTSEFTGMCDTCGSHFNSQRAMDEHIKLHNQTLINCSVCNRGFKTLEAMEKHQVKHEQDQYCCPHCGEQYMGKNSLNKHIKREHEKVQDPRYKCRLCPAFFSDVIEIRDHIATKHEGRNPYTCTLCSESFGTRPTLMRHMRREHEGLSPFVCETCGQSFHEKYILQRHMVSHGAPDPFVCPVCGKSLRNNLAVQKHIRKVHKETLTFACSKCGLRFPDHKELTKHHKRYCSVKRNEKKTTAVPLRHSYSSTNVLAAESMAWSSVFQMPSAVDSSFSQVDNR